MNVRFLAPARIELKDAVNYYNQQQKGLGKTFLNEVRGTIERIKAFPRGWSLLNGNIRRCQVRRFPYGVIYTVDGELLVIAIAHLHREPKYWETRL